MSSDSLAVTLFGKTRRAVLALLYTHPDETFYLREIARISNCAAGAVQRELKALYRAGIVTRCARGHEVHFQADAQCPIFPELRTIVAKTAGVTDVLREALLKSPGRLSLAFVYGSVASGRDHRSSDLDLLVVGQSSFSDIVAALATAQETLRREINPSVYAPGEFREKARAGHAFLHRVLHGPKLYVVGDANELARLVE